MRAVGTFLKWLGITAGTLCALGLLYQLTGNALDAKFAPPASQMIKVGGHDVHVFCISDGNRTYLLDAGAGVGAFQWDELVPLLAKSGRVCAFDRPGLGWSDDTGDAHDVAALVRWIARVVRAAHIPRPFVYVGHSLGGDDAMLYRGEHPRDVAALILIEPARPEDLLEGFRGTRAEAMTLEDCTLSCRASPALGWLGIMRIFAQVESAGSPGSPMADMYRVQISRPSLYKTILATLHTLPKSAYEVEDVKDFGDTPVLLLTASDPRTRHPHETEAQFRASRADQLAWFRRLAAMSSRGAGPTVIPNSSHATMVMSATGAAAVAKASLRFLDGPPAIATATTIRR